jgi:hypothetical protein
MLEEIPLGEDVLAGTFFLYEHPIIILFNSGVSHDFLSLTCAQKAVITLYATQVPYSISTPGGRVVANQMARKIPLKFGWLLSQIYSELHQDCQTHYGSSEERGEICLEC